MHLHVFRRRSRILWLIPPVLLVLVVACSSSARRGPPTASAWPSTAAATEAASTPLPTPDSSDRADLLAALDAFSRLKSYRATISAYVDGQERLLAKVEVVRPDRVHVVASDGSMEIIQTGGQSYLKSNGAWRKEEAANPYLSDPPKDLARIALNAGKVFERGSGFTADGKRCDLYVCADSDQTPIFFICVNGGLPFQIATQISGTDTTARFVDFNAPIAITAPIK